MLARSYNELGAGLRTFGLELSNTGNVLGTIIGDVKKIVDAAADPDFANRLRTAGQQGVFAELSPSGGVEVP